MEKGLVAKRVDCQMVCQPARSPVDPARAHYLKYHREQMAEYRKKRPEHYRKMNRKYVADFRRKTQNKKNNELLQGTNWWQANKRR